MIKSQTILQIFDVGYIWEERFALPRRTFAFLLFFFFLVEKFDFSTNFQPHVGPVYFSRTHKFYFSVTFSLKMDFMILFTHLKIILLRTLFFSFQFSAVSKQTHSQLLIGFHLDLPLISFFHLH